MRYVYVTDEYERAIGFYRDGLRFPIKDSWDNDESKGTVFVAVDGELEVHGPPDGGFTNDQIIGSWRALNGESGVLFKVDDIDAKFSEFESAGIEITVPMTQHPWGYKEFGIRDPDGHVVAFYAESGSQD